MLRLAVGILSLLAAAGYVEVVVAHFRPDIAVSPREIFAVVALAVLAWLPGLQLATRNDQRLPRDRPHRQTHHGGPMNLRDYQIAARRTSSGQGITNAALGLVGEAGEVAELVKKHLYHGHALDRGRLADELGDVLWYVAEMTTECGLMLTSPDYNDPFPPRRPRAGDLGDNAIDVGKEAAAFATHIDDPRNIILALADLALHIGMTLDEIADRNIAKLRARYPDGFDPKRSQNREAE